MENWLHLLAKQRIQAWETNSIIGIGLHEKNYSFVHIIFCKYKTPPIQNQTVSITLFNYSMKQVCLSRILN